MMNLSGFKPKQEKKIKLAPNVENLAAYERLSEDAKVWADETILYDYLTYAKEKIARYLEINSNESLNSVKAITDAILANDTSLTDRQIMQLRSVAIRLWKERIST